GPRRVAPPGAAAMSDSQRDAFLARVRQAVQTGNRPGSAAPLRERGTLGYQGDGGDPVATFCREFEAAGGHVHVVPEESAARGVRGEGAAGGGGRGVRGSGGVAPARPGAGPPLNQREIGPALSRAGCGVTAVEALTADTARDPIFAAEAGVSGVKYLVAETG